MILKKQNKKKPNAASTPLQSQYGTAFARNLPCLNPNCKSHGTPHPNCRCYGGNAWQPMSEGGEVGFCSTARNHQSGCQYFKDGGVVKFSDLKDEGAPKQEQPVAKFSDLKDEGPPKNFQEKEVASKDFSNFESLKDEGKPKGTEEAPENTVLGIAKDAAKTIFATSPLGVISGHTKQMLDSGWKEMHPQSKAFIEKAIPFGQAIEKKIGLDTEENIIKRERLYPDTQLAGQVAQAVYTGAAARAIPAVEAAYQGSKVFGNILLSVSQGAMDDVSRYMSGAGPQNVGDFFSSLVAHGAMNILAGGIAGKLSPVLDKVPDKAEEKIVKHGTELLVKLGSDPVTASGIASSLGIGAAGYGTMHAIGGNYMDAAQGWALGAFNKLILEQFLKYPVNKTNQFLSWAAAKALATNNPEALPLAQKIGSLVGTNIRLIDDAIGFDNIIRGATSKFIPYATEKQKEHFKDFIENGGPFLKPEELPDTKLRMSEPKFAKGGEVKAPIKQKDHFAELYPEASVMLGAARGRVYNYLNSIRPTNNIGGLMYDTHRRDKQKERTYNAAIEYAINPLTIMNKVNSGRLTTDDMRHFSSMWPDVYSFISKKITKKMIESKMSGDKKPPYKNIKSLSLFLGSDLDSTITQQSIASVQMMYQIKKGGQRQQTTKPPKPNTISKLAPSALTDAQARTFREQRQKA